MLDRRIDLSSHLLATLPPDRLRQLLTEIAISEKDYEQRNRKVIMAVVEAQNRNLDAGFRIDPAEPEWPVAYIELPTGQVSWHLKQHAKPWDGHDDAAKWLRILQFLGMAPVSITNIRIQ